MYYQYAFCHVPSVLPYHGNGGVAVTAKLFYALTEAASLGQVSNVAFGYQKEGDIHGIGPSSSRMSGWKWVMTSP